jgi:hypothetical protein
VKAVVGAVLPTVAVTVTADVPLTVAEAGIVQVGGSLAAPGVMAHFRLTTPIKPPDGVIVIVDVFPVVAPGETVMEVPETAKPGGVAMISVPMRANSCCADVALSEFDARVRFSVNAMEEFVEPDTSGVKSTVRLQLAPDDKSVDEVQAPDAEAASGKSAG